jgi:hypothetical protein
MGQHETSAKKRDLRIVARAGTDALAHSHLGRSRSRASSPACKIAEDLMTLSLGLNSRLAPALYVQYHCLDGLAP